MAVKTAATVAKTAYTVWYSVGEGRLRKQLSVARCREFIRQPTEMKYTH